MSVEGKVLFRMSTILSAVRHKSANLLEQSFCVGKCELWMSCQISCIECIKYNTAKLVALVYFEQSFYFCFQWPILEAAQYRWINALNAVVAKMR